MGSAADEVRDGAADADLVAVARAGGQRGFTGLLRRHRDAVFRLARNHIGDETEALDITQECFISAFAALHRYDPQRSFRAWILRIALNKCRDWARRRAVRRFFLLARPLEESLHVADDTLDPEAALAANQAMDRLRAAIARLPVALKDPLLLCAVEGLSQEEAAQVLKISRKAIETRIYRARQKLSEMLEG